MATKVKPIPEGCHNVIPHLVVRGAAQAIEFYKNVFGAKERFRSPGPGGRVMHAELEIGDSRIYLNEEFPEMGSLSPLGLNGTPITIHLWTTNVDEVFGRALQSGAQALMPVADQFWGDRYALIVDPYGHRWALATHVKDMTPQEMQKAAAEAFAAMKK